MWSKELLEYALEKKLDIDFPNSAKIDFNSGRITKGDIFIALLGAQGDGIDYVNDAYEKGASYVIVNRVVSNIPDAQQIIVSDTYETLIQLAKFKRSQYQGCAIGITGSLGKTSVKDFCHYIFAQKYKSYATYGNFNNHIGLPLCLANLDLESEYAFFELGMNHAGEIRFLTKILEPDYAIISTISNVHIGNFADIFGIIAAKSEIVEGLKPGGKLILNTHGGYFPELYHHLTEEKKFPVQDIVAITKVDEEFESIDYPDLQMPLTLVNARSQRDFSLIIDFKNTSSVKQIVVPAFKAKTALTFLFPFLLLELFTHNYDDLLDSAKKYEIPKGRGRIEKLTYKEKRLWLVDESYNSSPEAVRSLLSDISSYHFIHGYQIVFFMGEMLELGSDSEGLHINLADDIRKAGITKFIAVGNKIALLYENIARDLKESFYYKNVHDLLPELDSYVVNDAIIIVKGSRGIEMDLVITKLQGLQDDS